MQKKAHKHPYQQYTNKDSLRIEDLVKKAARAADKRHADSWSYENQEAFNEEAAKLAHRMARTIKDWKKAARRGSAAENENFHSFAKVFFDRADELWRAAGSPAAPVKYASLRGILASEGLLPRLARAGQRLPAERKDKARIQSMLAKSTRDGELSLAKVQQYAAAMARAIKDWAKAEQRGSALVDVGLAPIAKIFFDRADEMKPVDSPRPNLDSNYEKYYVIPMGSVSFRNGNNRTFNFLQTWGGELFSFIVVEINGGPYSIKKAQRVVLVGSGVGGYSHPGEIIEMIGDQNNRFLGTAVVVRVVSGVMDEDLLQRASQVVGKSSARAYVIK
jgi:hypothetical protein